MVVLRVNDGTSEKHPHVGVAVNPCCCHLGCRRAASQATLCTYLRTACRSQELMTIVEDLIFVTIVAVPIAVATLDVFLLVPSFTLNTTIAFATLDVSCSCHCCPHLVTLAAISWMFLATRVIIDSHCHPCCCHLGCFLFVPPLSSYCRHCCCHLGCFFAARGLASIILSPWLIPPWSFLAIAIGIALATRANVDPHLTYQHCYCHLGLFLLLVVLPPSSCHHG